MNASPADLNYVISLDPVLVGRLLHLLNSAYYGLNHHVTSLVRAIIMLGINTVKNFALSSAVLGNLPINKNNKGLNIKGFWQHSLCVGVTAKLLAKKKKADLEIAEEYFTAGLLHDIGKIPLSAVLSSEYLLTVGNAEREKKTLFAEENSSLGINHCEAGAMIANAWKFEGPVADVVIHHHNLAGYSGNNRNIIYDVAIANYFALINETGFAGDRNPEKPAPEIWKAAGIKESAFEEIKETVHLEIEKAKVFLNIHDIST
jgi:putative nucleotidyltransferase with HDIG domain